MTDEKLVDTHQTASQNSRKTSERVKDGLNELRKVAKRTKGKVSKSMKKLATLARKDIKSDKSS
jgi:hypothetical protein